jgi:predicted RNase H-like HicB family nuclease
LVLDLIVTKTDDGFSTDIPSIKGCDSWAHEEEEAISKTIELLQFYLQRPSLKVKIDLARRESPNIIYKLIFDK